MFKTNILCASLGALSLLTGSAACDGDLAAFRAAKAAPKPAAASPSVEAASPPAVLASHEAGFVTFERDGALWIFREGSPESEQALGGHELAKHVTRVQAAAGAVQTVKSADTETLDAWAARKPGHVTRVQDGRLWVFRAGDAAVRDFDAGVEPAKHVTRVTATPAGVQVVKAIDSAVIDGYAATRGGYVGRKLGEHLWIFRAGSEELKTMDGGGELAKHVTRLTATPFGVQVLKAPDLDLLDGWLASPPGFAARKVAGTLWVFREGSSELATMDGGGELVKHVTRVQATPSGVVSVKAADFQTLDAWATASRTEAPGKI